MDLHYFYAYIWPFKISDNVVSNTPPQVSGGLLSLLLAVRVSVRPSVRISFPFGSLSIYKRISFKFCTNNGSLRIVNGKIISIIYHRVMALVNVQKMVFGL